MSEYWQEQTCDVLCPECDATLEVLLEGLDGAAQDLKCPECGESLQIGEAMCFSIEALDAEE